jgi:DNA-binding FadR family transcriptional regulator
VVFLFSFAYFEKNIMAISKVDAVTDVLLDLIVKGEFKDTLPPQDVLSSNFGISRTTVREAISKLESWNVVVVRPKIGTKINPPNTWAMVNVALLQHRFKAEGIEIDSVMIERVVDEIRTTLLREVQLAAVPAAA